MMDSIENLSNAVAIVTGFLKNDSKLIGTSIKDVIVEPARKHMIPGFDKVKHNALNAGALGVTISGAGPSVIAFATKSSNLKKIQKAMEKGFSSSGIKCSGIICSPCKGAIDSKS
jgi:homoserine kinase